MFLILHFNYKPFVSQHCNMVQSCCLGTLSTMYFAGLLLKVELVDKGDEDSLGILLVTVLLLALSSALYVIISQVGC